MSALTITSVNVQGLGNYQKRRDVFQHLRQKNCSIYFLQDTHFESKVEKQIRAEWGFECCFASHTSQSRGVAILFNNNFDFEVKQTVKDKQGNYIILTIKTMNQEITLVNIYGPNNDNPQFYLTLQEKIRQLQNPKIIIGGDWNLVLNPSIDYYNYKHNNNVNAQKQVIDMIDQLELVDVWREVNPETLRYSWRRQTPPQQARLDFFLISENLITFVNDSDILLSYRSDHSPVTMKLEFSHEKKSSSFWKFNSSLLKELKYVEEVNTVIKRVKEQYAALVYERDKVEGIPIEQLHMTISDQLFLDTLIMEIRKKTMEYSSKQKKRQYEGKAIRERTIYLTKENNYYKRGKARNARNYRKTYQFEKRKNERCINSK